jgi:hypothetical protein
VGADSATRLSQASIFSVAREQVQKAGDRREHAITFGRDSLSGICASPMASGDATNGRVNSNWPGAFADIHNHLNDQPPSAGDLYNLIKISSNRQGYNTRFVITPGGFLYALYVYDMELAKAFVAKYPLEQSPGFSPRFPEPVFDDIDKITMYFESHGVRPLLACERAMAFVLDRYKAGVVLLKQDSIGNFKVLQTGEKTLKRKTIYVVKECF